MASSLGRHASAEQIFCIVISLQLILPASVIARSGDNSRHRVTSRRANARVRLSRIILSRFIEKDATPGQVLFRDPPKKPEKRAAQKRFRALAKLLHPDAVVGDVSSGRVSEGQLDKIVDAFRAVSAAYDAVSGPASRREEFDVSQKVARRDKTSTPRKNAAHTEQTARTKRGRAVVREMFAELIEIESRLKAYSEAKGLDTLVSMQISFNLTFGAVGPVGRSKWGNGRQWLEHATPSENAHFTRVRRQLDQLVGEAHAKTRALCDEGRELFIKIRHREFSSYQEALQAVAALQRKIPKGIYAIRPEGRWLKSTLKPLKNTQRWRKYYVR